MSIVCIARQYNMEEVKFKVSYLKNSVWLRNNGDARVTLHCVIRAYEDSAEFKNLRIVVPGGVAAKPKCTNDPLLDKDYMREYEDDEAKLEINKDKSYIRNNGGDYFLTDVAVGDVNKINKKFTEFIVKLEQPVTPKKARGFRIEFISKQYAKKEQRVYKYQIGLYHLIKQLQGLSNNYHDSDIVGVEYSDIWVILPSGMEAEKISSNIGGYKENLNLEHSTGRYVDEINKYKKLEGKEAYRWRINKRNIPPKGVTISGKFSSPPLSKWWAYLAIVLTVIGILITIILTIFYHLIF